MASPLLDSGIFPFKSSSSVNGISGGSPISDSSLLQLPQEAHGLLRSLALKLWSDMLADVGHVSVRALKGAMTNQVYECCWNNVPEEEEQKREEDEEEEEEGGKQKQEKKERRRQRRVVLVRVYGEGVEHFFDREGEIQTFEAISKAGYGPRLLGHFPNGRVEEFLHARTLTAGDLRDRDVSARIAVKLREFHGLSMPGPQEPQIWQRLRDWLQKALTLCSPENVDEFRLRDLGREIEELRERISRPDSEVGFCHNDLQYGNIMMDEEDNTVTIIDYEYSSYNPVAFDLANHFCEMTVDYHTDTPHLLDYSKYPDLQERCRFISAYLEGSGNVASPSQLEQLAKETDGYALASHIYWGLWGIISACVNEIDFNYMEYARQRFNQYYLSKWNLVIDR